MFSTLSLLLTSCTSGTALPTPYALGEPQTLPDSQAVVAADIDGDGVDEILRFVDGTLSWEGGSAELGGTFQRAARGDVDGDGLEEAIVATGMGRADRTAPARIWAVDRDGATLLLERASARAQVPELRVVDGKVWAGLFAADNVVESGWVSGEALQVEQSAKLALRQIPTSKGVVVGRVYGDIPKSDGDLTLHGPSGAQKLPSFRGVRSVTEADLNGDGEPELLVGDGWHFAYGTQAIGRIALLDGPDWQQSRVIAHFATDYSAQEIEVHDGRILVIGTSTVHLLQRDSWGWQDLEVAKTSEGGSAAWVQRAEGPAIVVAGSPTQVIPLQ